MGSSDIISLESKIEDIAKRLNRLEINEEKVSLKCNSIEDTVADCCSKKNLEERIVAHSDLRNLIREFKKFNENGEKRDSMLDKRFEEYEKRLIIHERYFLIGVGIILTLEALGVGDIIKKQLLGA